MSKLQKLNLRLHVDCNGKLRVTAGGVGDIWIVVGFKIKTGKQKKNLFPILKIEIQKK